MCRVFVFQTVQPGQSASGQNNCKEVFIAVLQTFLQPISLSDW